MEVIVCIKQVPGTTEVEVDEKTGVLKREGIASKMNPYDLYAVETAMQIKARMNAQVTALSMGPLQAQKVLKEAYMMGVDQSVLLSDRRFAGADVLATSYALAQGIKKCQSPDLIICGKMTTDGDTAQVGPEIAEFLAIPHVTNVTKIIEVKEDKIKLQVDMPFTTEIVEVFYPCLITVEKGIFQPRLPSYRLKLATKEKKIKVLTLADLDDIDETHYGLSGSPTQVKRIFAPSKNDGQVKWTGESPLLADKLIEQLRELKLVEDRSEWEK